MIEGRYTRGYYSPCSDSGIGRRKKRGSGVRRRRRGGKKERKRS